MYLVIERACSKVVECLRSSQLVCTSLSNTCTVGCEIYFGELPIS